MIGVASAYALLQKGVDVTLLDLNPHVAQATSAANGGQIAASHAIPWAAPGIAPLLLRSLVDPSTVFSAKWGRDAQRWKFLLQFLIRCRQQPFRQAAIANIRLAQYSLAQLLDWTDQENLTFDQRPNGILTLLPEDHHVVQASEDLKWLQQSGADLTLIDHATAITLEPALAQARFQGALYAKSDLSGNAQKFTEQLLAVCLAKGMEWVKGCEVTGFQTSGDRVEQLITSLGLRKVDQLVIAAGINSEPLGQMCGLALPIQPVKGYSVTIPLTEDDLAPQVSITDERRRIVVSRLGNDLRIAGIADIVGFDHRFYGKRAKLVLEGYLELFPKPANILQSRFWTGLRPMTADNIPIISRSPFQNLFLNTGHGAYGWTMACGSAQLVADLITQQSTALRSEAYRLER